MRTVARGLGGLALLGSAGLVLVPRSVPSIEAFGDPATEAVLLSTFALRVIATGLCAYLALVVVAVLLVRLRLLPGAVHEAVDRWTGGGLAGAVRRVVGASALTVGLLPFAPTAAHATPAAPPVLAPMEEVEATTVAPPRIEPAPTTTAPAPPPTIVPRPGPAAAAPGPRPETPSIVPRPSDPPPAATHPTSSARTTSVTVRPGDSFWSIAEQLVTLRLQRPPTEPEVIGPWLDLIERNRDVLPHPDDADLLLPGTVLALPTRPAG